MARTKSLVAKEARKTKATQYLLVDQDSIPTLQNLIMVYKREPNASLLIMIWSKSLSSVVKLAHYIRSSLLVMKAWDKIIIVEWKVFEN